MIPPKKNICDEKEHKGHPDAEFQTGKMMELRAQGDLKVEIKEAKKKKKKDGEAEVQISTEHERGQ